MKPEKTSRRKPEWFTSMLLPDLLINLVFFLAVQSLGTMMMAFESNLTGKYIIMLWLLIPMLGYFIVRRLVISVVPMLIAHLCIAAAPLLFLGGTDIRVSFWIEMMNLFLMVYSLSKKYRKSFVEASQLMVILTLSVNFLLLLVLLFYKEFALMPYVFSSCLISICFFLAAKQMLDFESSFEHFLVSPTQPGRRIKANNRRVILILFLVMTVIIPVSILLPYDALQNAVEKFATYITALLFFLLSLIPKQMTYSYDEDTNLADPEPEKVPEGISQVLQIIEIIIAVVIVVFLLVVAWKGIKKLFLFLRDQYIVRHRTVQFSENVFVTDEVIALEVDRKAKRRKHHDFGNDRERKIRKEYYETVRKGIRQGLPYQISSSTSEIQQKMKDQLGMDVTELTREYEKTRYGNP